MRVLLWLCTVVLNETEMSFLFGYKFSSLDAQKIVILTTVDATSDETLKNDDISISEFGWRKRVNHKCITNQTAGLFNSLFKLATSNRQSDSRVTVALWGKSKVTGELPPDSPHKGPVMWKLFPDHDVIRNVHPYLGVLSHKPSRATIYWGDFNAKSREVSKPRDWMLYSSYRSEIC